MLSLADFHMNILLKGVEIEQGQGDIPGVVSPVGSCNTLIHLTGIPDIEQRELVCSKTEFEILTRTLLCIRSLLAPLQLDQETHQCNYFLPMSYPPKLPQ